MTIWNEKLLTFWSHSWAFISMAPHNHCFVYLWCWQKGFPCTSVAGRRLRDTSGKRGSVSSLLLCAVTQLHVLKAHCTLSLCHQFWMAKHYCCYGSNYFTGKKGAVHHGRNAFGCFLLILIAAFSRVLISRSSISCTLCFALQKLNSLQILRQY